MSQFNSGDFGSTFTFEYKVPKYQDGQKKL